MRPAHIVAGFLVLLSFLFISYTSAASSNRTATMSIPINTSINDTAAYIASVQNESYFVFYPNLQQANIYLGEAQNISSKNTTEALMLLSQARQSAYAQQQYLSMNKAISFAILGALTVISALALIYIAHPRRKKNVR